MPKLFLFTGENTQALQDKLKFWEKAFIEKHGEANLEKWKDLSDSDIGRIAISIETQPFLAEKRMIIISGIPRSAADNNPINTEILEKVLEDFPETTLVIFVSPNPDKRTRFYKKLSSLAQIERFPLLKGRDLEQWIVQRFTADGKKIDSRATELLLMSCSDDMNRLASEIDKLILIDCEMVHERDVERFVSHTPETKIFNALDLIGKASSQQVLQQFQVLARSGVDMIMVFYMLVRQFRLLIQIRFLLNERASPSQLEKRLNLAPFQVNMLSRQARYFELEQLKAAYEQLIKIDFQIKTGRLPTNTNNQEMLYLKIDQFLCSLYE